MARRMYSIDQISGSNINLVAGNGISIENNTISLSLYAHNIQLTSFDDSMQAYMTVYSVNSAPVTTKQELLDNLLGSNSMSATGTAEAFTKLIFLIDSAGQLHYTDLQGNTGIYSDDYTVSDSVTSM